LYLRSRGIDLDIYPTCLRTSAHDWYHDDETGETSPHPAMLALVTNSDGEHVATHRTFLAVDGLGKAKVSKPRKMAGPSGSGPAIRLMPAAPIMGIAEGIETAFSATLLFQVPVWSVLCAYGIETFEPPAECQHLIVFADNDRHDASYRAARALCARRSLPIEIRMPDQPGSDWNDVLLEVSR
jgi:putative DNA primase/helicase